MNRPKPPKALDSIVDVVLALPAESEIETRATTEAPRQQTGEGQVT
jgi:hypothetical protein